MIPTGDSIPEPLVREHAARLQDLMRRDDLAAVILFHPSNMLAFTGTAHASWDRLTCGAVTRDAEIHVLCPAFERPAVAGAERIAAVHTWEEQEDAYRRFATILRSAGVKAGRVGVDGRMWLDSFHRFQRAFDGLQVQSAEALIREVRLCKSPSEQEAMRAAHRQGEQAFLALQQMVRPGVREIELHKELAERLAGRGLTFDPMIQSGPNGAVPHNPTGDRMLQEADLVVVDSVIVWQGYNNDLTRTFAIGRPSPKAKKAYQTVRRAQAAALEAARPGLPCRELDQIARAVIADAGFGPFFIHRLGHGIGIECHEPPYLDAANDELLRPGMCCTVEPGVYIPGEFGIRIEDDIIITHDGCEVIRGQLPTDVTDAFDQ
jgi:Xaa-Pro dipeptidase